MVQLSARYVSSEKRLKATPSELCLHYRESDVRALVIQPHAPGEAHSLVQHVPRAVVIALAVQTVGLQVSNDNGTGLWTMKIVKRECLQRP